MQTNVEQMNSFKIDAYIAAGCTMLPPQKDGLAAMHAVHGLTGGRLCDTGCVAFRGGKCSAYMRLTRNLPAQPISTETVKQEAARLGISISEVRRRRNPSTASV